MPTANEGGIPARVSTLWAMLLVSAAVVTQASRVHAEPEPPDLGEENLFHLAAEGGYDTPLGRVGLAVEIHPLRRLVLAGGLGLYTNELGHFELALAVSSRFRLFLLGNTSLSAGLGLSREDRPPQRYQDGQVFVYREWNGAIRLNPEISLEHHFDHRWAVRGFVGLGVVLTDATCTTSINNMYTQGSCLSPDVPAQYRDDPIPLVPYAGLAIDASWRGPPPAVQPAWYGWQIALVDVASAVALLSGSNSSTVSTGEHWLFYGGLALYSLGGPAVHVAHQDGRNAIISFALRTLPALAAYALAPAVSDGGGDYRYTLATMAAAAIVDWTVLGWSR